ncbi:MAG TPA: 8-amino-7-oxononanoate synthase [Polyangia bacterium]|nr:8-amino-7-oxononanoate synthase [Polyangia bacterium]
MRSLSTILEAELAELAAVDRLRSCPETSGVSRVHPIIANQPRLSFCSNDYLGLASHPRIISAANTAAERDGFGASASRLISGDLPAHRDLEAALATFVGLPSALVFPTGFQANLGVLTALAGPQDLIVSDALNHASIIDGCRLSRAKIAVYPHADAQAAAGVLAGAAGYRRRILVTESLFSMDGDAAPLDDLARATGRHDAILIVDEAHAFGVLGPGGRGLCAAAGIVPDVLVATLGKALGAAGGFVAGDRALRDILVNRARAFIYTTALPPPIAAAAAAALELVASTEGDRLRSRLAGHRASLGESLARLGLGDHPSGTLSGAPAIAGPIVPIRLGSEARALAASAALGKRGIFVPAIRPPTVPAGSARLRITLSAAHQGDDLVALTAALAALATLTP